MFREHQERHLWQYWLDTFGKCHKWDEDHENKVSLHYEIALKKFPESRDPDQALMNLGWIKIGVCTGGNLIKNSPTQAQVNKMFDLGLRHLVDANGVKIKIF